METVDFTQALAFLGESGPFLLTTHRNADGDGIGAVLALSGLLDQMQKPHQIVINDEQADGKFAFLEGFERIQSFEAHTDRSPYSHALIVDTPTASPDRIGDVASLMDASTRRMVIDHHAGGVDDVEVLVMDSGASAASELIYLLIKASGHTLTPAMATQIYAGIAFDTKLFKFSNPERALKAAADLADLGADPAHIADALFAHQSLETVQTLGHALSTLELHAAGRVATLHVAHDFYVLGGDMDPVVDHAMSIDGVEVAIFIKEQAPGSQRVSLRSRGSIDVNAIARKHGGGGHRNASGCTLEMPLDDVRKILADSVIETLIDLNDT